LAEGGRCRLLAARRQAEAKRPPRQFFAKLKPFKELVAEDIRDGDESG
jgi:hypothetical protein